MQNKSIFKRILTGVLSAALVVTGVNFTNLDSVQAAKKVKSMTITTTVGGETVEVSKKDQVPVQIVKDGSQHFDVTIDGAGSFKVKSKNKAIKAKADADKTGFDVWRGDFGLIVSAVIVVKVKVVDACEQMIIEPLFKVVSLVFENRHDRQIMQK